MEERQVTCGVGVADNNIGDAGAIQLAEALKTNRSLTTLSLFGEYGGGMKEDAGGGGWVRGACGGAGWRDGGDEREGAREEKRERCGCGCRLSACSWIVFVVVYGGKERGRCGVRVWWWMNCCRRERGGVL